MNTARHTRKKIGVQRIVKFWGWGCVQERRFETHTENGRNIRRDEDGLIGIQNTEKKKTQ